MGLKPRVRPAAVPPQAQTSELTHFNPSGAARMVEVAAKAETERLAIASGRVLMDPATARLIEAGLIGKGDVLGVARIAAIQSVKRTSDLIPLCHPLRVTGVDVDFKLRTRASAWVAVTASVRALDRTGVEMEALTAVATACLTIYDMCKAVDRAMRIEEIRLDMKSGGKAGTWRR